MKKKDIKSKEEPKVKITEKVQQLAKTAKKITDDAKIAKAINHKVEKAEKQKTLVDKIKERVAVMREVANAQADRIIEAAIKREEQAKAWAERYRELKKKADDKRKDAAIFKREAKAKVRLSLAELRNSPTIPHTKEVEKNQEDLEKLHQQKLKEKEELKAKRFKFKRRAAINRVHHKELAKEATKPSEETKRKQAMTPEERAAEYRKIEAEARERFIKSEITPNSNKEKRLKREQELAEHRLKRMEKKQAMELTAKQKRDADIQRFLKSEKTRKERKLVKSAKYLTKGGIEVPKVKNKVEVDKDRAKVFIEEASKKHKVLSKRYIGVSLWKQEDGSIIERNIISGVYGTLETLKTVIDKEHENNMKQDPINYIGVYYHEDMNMTIIEERINEKHNISYLGKTISVAA